MAGGKPRNTTSMRPSDKGCASSHRLKWDPLLPNEVSKIARQEGRWMERRKGQSINCLKKYYDCFKVLMEFINNQRYNLFLYVF